MLENSLVAAQLAASQEGLSSLELGDLCRAISSQIRAYCQVLFETLAACLRDSNVALLCCSAVGDARAAYCAV
jgi:hypothetical protein